MIFGLSPAGGCGFSELRIEQNKMVVKNNPPNQQMPKHLDKTNFLSYYAVIEEP